MTTERTGLTTLVGRAQELERLGDLVGLRSEGSRRTGAVLLSGDAGVGKTRLLSELAEQATRSGWRVMVGHCLDFGDSALPYLPFSEAFGRLAAEAPQLAESLVEQSPALARLMPRRRLMVDGAHEVAADGRVDRVDRSELFEAVHAALEQLGRELPLLLLVEDVHWADQSTRDTLSFLFTRGFTEPVAVVASYRSDDLHRRHPLRTVAAEWARLPGVERVPLLPLADGDVRSLVRVLHPRPMAETDMRGIIARAEGNAFFTEELVAAAGRGGRALPTDLAELLLVRLDQLDDSARLTVRSAAVAGRRVSHEMLARVVGVDADSLERALRLAVESNVLVPVSADGYAFRHALLAEAIYDDLLPGERVRLHSAYAAALSTGGLDGTAAELARHARAAHDVATAVLASIQAGDEAMSVGGPDEATKHYETAIELLAEPSASGTVQVDAVDLVLRASEAAAAAGQSYRAVGLLQDQIASLPDDAPAEQRARLLHALASMAFLTETTIDILALTTESLRLVPDEPPSRLRAHVMSVHARANADHRRDDDAAMWAGKALALARELDLPDVAADAKTTLARLDERGGDPDSAIRTLTQSIDGARAAREIAAELRGLFNLGGLHFELGQLVEARAAYESAAERARLWGRPWAPYGVDARAIAGIVAYVAGDWDDVLGIVDITGEAPPGTSEAQLSSVGLAVAAGRGQRRALDLLPHLRPWWEREGMVAINVGAAAIDLHGDAGDLESALAAYDEVVTEVAALWEQPYFQARIRLGGLLLGQIGSAASRTGARERAELATRAGDVAESVAVVAERGQMSGRRGPESQAWLARVDAEHARVRWLTGVDAPTEDELVGRWEAAVDLFRSFGHVFETARSRARLAAVLRAAGRPEDARREADLAREVARGLGAAPLLAELRALGGRGDQETGGAERRDEPLTAREREVLALVAEGRSNREIAAQLFISAKTVSVHVSNVMAKLGAGGRTEAVALARRRGLLSDT